MMRRVIADHIFSGYGKTRHSNAWLPEGGLLAKGSPFTLPDDFRFWKVHEVALDRKPLAELPKTAKIGDYYASIYWREGDTH